MAKEILYNHKNHFIKGDAMERFRDLFAPEGILTMETGERWETLHPMLEENTFNPRNFPKQYGALLKEHFDTVITSWQNQHQDTPFDLYNEITQFTMAVISETFFSYRMSKGEISTIVPAFKYVLDYIQSR